MLYYIINFKYQIHTKGSFLSFRIIWAKNFNINSNKSRDIHINHSEKNVTCFITSLFSNLTCIQNDLSYLLILYELRISTLSWTKCMKFISIIQKNNRAFSWIWKDNRHTSITTMTGFQWTELTGVSHFWNSESIRHGGLAIQSVVKWWTWSEFIKAQKVTASKCQQNCLPSHAQLAQLAQCTTHSCLFLPG